MRSRHYVDIGLKIQHLSHVSSCSKCTNKLFAEIQGSIDHSFKSINEEPLRGERAPALDLKEAATWRFETGDVVSDLFIETHFSHLIALLSNFSKRF